METKSKPYNWRKDQNALSGIAAGVYCVHDEALRHTVDCNICNPKPIKELYSQEIDYGLLELHAIAYEQGRKQDEKLEVWKYISILAAFTLIAFIAELLYKGLK